MRRLMITCALALVVSGAHALAQQVPPPPPRVPAPQGLPGMTDPRATASREAKGTAIIRGRVVSAETGRPLRHATVAVTGENRPQRSVYTDENGQFECKELAAGQYLARVSLVGYVPLEFGEDPESGGAREIPLADGVTFDKADFRLPRGGVISGRIVDDAGEPLEGVQVQALTLQYAGGMERLAPVTAQASRRSSDIGRYRLFGLPPGEYYVAATPGAFNMSAPAAGDMAAGYAVTYYPGSADVANAQKVTVSAGQETQADFSVVPGPMFDVSGVVLDFSGRPLAGAAVLLVPGTSASIGVMARQVSGADGSFRFAGIAAGAYTLQLQPLLGAPPPPPGAGASAAPPPPQFASTLVNVAGHVANIVLQGRPGRTVTGEVVAEGGQPLGISVRSVRILARPVDFTRSPMIEFGTQMRINDDRTFEVRNLWGPCVMNVIAPAGWTVKAVRAGGMDMTDKPIDFDRNPGPLQIVLTDQVTQLSGTVTDQGRPAARVAVLVFASDPGRWEFQSRYLRRVIADDEGRFSVSGLPAAEYRVIALPRMKSGTSWQRPDFLEPLTRSAARVVLHDGERTSVDLRLTRD